jgi:hypothetical protein
VGDRPPWAICKCLSSTDCHILSRCCTILTNIQAQTNAGGLALWGADGSMGALRTSDEDYHESWSPYISEVARIIATNQITNDGVCIHLHAVFSHLELMVPT